jgi:hypothetical protein
MKILELNAKNLHSIGITIDILNNKNDLNVWLKKNDVRINYVTNEIYIEIESITEFINNEGLLLKRDLNSSELKDFDMLSMQYKTEFEERLFNNDLDNNSQSEFIAKAISKWAKTIINVRENKINDLVNGIFETIESEEIQKVELNNFSKTKKAKDYKDFIWFKTGLKLATGEAYDLYNKYKLDKGHFTKICLELGFKESDRTYFSSTINDNETDKNTFIDKDKLNKLHTHLIENNLPFGVNFLEKYNQIETE